MTPLSRYTCEEAFRRLDDYLDRELGAAEMELVRQHLEICEGCAREFNFEDSVLQGVRAKLREVDVPDDLQARLLGMAAKVLDQEKSSEG
jgi:anti-sigma factor (TIGR02949 family)